MLENQMYVPQTLTIIKNGVTLFETDCEVLIEYYFDAGEIDWRPVSFHFEGRGAAPEQRLYADINKTEPLWAVLNAALEDAAIVTAICDHLDSQ